MPKIYLDNGATTQLDKRVLREMSKYYTKEYGNANSLHFYGEKAKKALDEARNVIAKSINAELEEIIFTGGGTEANNLAIQGLANMQKEKNRIITTKIEHPSVLETCKHLEKKGFIVNYLNVNNEGLINLEELKKVINQNTFLVTIMHANNEIGTLQDIRIIGKICRENNIIFHTDAIQSYTKEKLDVKEMNIDLMSLNAHKIHGPKGLGALYVRKGIKISKLMHGGGQENNIRPGTENIPGIVGFAEAVKLIKKEDLKKIKNLRNYTIKEISRIPDVILNGAKKERLCNNINFSFKFVEGESLLMHLSLRGIAVSTGSACSSKNLEPSHVLMAIGLNPELAHGSLRITLSRFNNKKEIDYLIKNLKEVVVELRRFSPIKR